MEGKPAPVREDGDGVGRVRALGILEGGGKERVFQGMRAWGKKDHIGIPWHLRMDVMAQRCIFVNQLPFLKPTSPWNRAAGCCAVEFTAVSSHKHRTNGGSA